MIGLELAALAAAKHGSHDVDLEGPGLAVAGAGALLELELRRGRPA